MNFDPQSGLVFADNTVQLPWHDCKNFRRKKAYSCGSGLFREREFTIWQCSKCGMGFTEPVPTPETAHFLYESRESLDFQPDSSSLMARLKRSAATRDLRSFLSPLTVPGNPSILDFSCGDGMFTLAAKTLLPGAQVFGTDMHDDPPPLLSTESYLNPSDLQNKGSAWDVILCRHVLEHSYTPVEMLLELKALLRPGGYLVIEVPALDAVLATLFGKYWDGYYVPFHPIHFTRASLRTTLEAASYTVVRESSSEMPKIGRSLQNILHCSYNVALFGLGIALHPLQLGIGAATGRPVCRRIWGQNS